MTSRPSIVLVAGGWHTTECLDPVTRLLQDKEYEVEVVQQVTVGAGAGSRTPEDTAEAIRAAVERVTRRGKDVLLVAHSNGGRGACDAMRWLNKDSNTHRQGKGRVRRIALIAGFILSKSFESEHIHVPWWNVRGTIVTPDNPQHIFYNDLPAVEADYWASKLLPMTYEGAFKSEIYEGWRDAPVSYLRCLEDNALTLEMQDAMLETATAEGVEVDVFNMSSSHSPFLSMPDKTVEWIERLATM